MRPSMRTLIIAVVLILYTALIFLPPIVHGYVYPNNGDDSAYHLLRIDDIKSGEGAFRDYMGDGIVGYPIVWINRLTGVSIDVLFLWFNFVVLWLVGVSVFVLLWSAISWQAGLLAIPLVMFCVPSALNLFDTGAVFDLMTVGIILPLLLACVLRIVMNGKWIPIIIPTVLLAILAVVLHSMGILSISRPIAQTITLLAHSPPALLVHPPPCSSGANSADRRVCQWSV